MVLDRGTLVRVKYLRFVRISRIDWTDVMVNFSKASPLVPLDTLLMSIAATGVDLRVVVWVKEFLLGRSESVRADGQLSEEVGVPQGSVLGPLLFLVYVNGIWRNTECNIWLFAFYCMIYRKVMESSDIDKLQTDRNRLAEWAVENEMKINPGKSKAVSFTKARVKERIRY